MNHSPLPAGKGKGEGESFERASPCRFIGINRTGFLYWFGTGDALFGAMNLSIIAFGVMTGFAVLFMAAMFLMERSSSRIEFPKSDVAETEDDNPFKISE